MATTKQAKKPAARKPAAKKTSAKKAQASLKNTVEDVVDAVENVVDDVQDKAESVFASSKDAAKQLWFANLGVYGRAFEAVQTGVSKLTEARQSLVSNLVARGEKVQDDAESLIKESRGNVEEKVEEVSARLAKVSPLLDVNANMKKLSERLESVRNSFKKAA